MQVFLVKVGKFSIHLQEIIDDEEEAEDDGDEEFDPEQHMKSQGKPFGELELCYLVVLSTGVVQVVQLPVYNCYLSSAVLP